MGFTLGKICLLISVIVMFGIAYFIAPPVHYTYLYYAVYCLSVIPFLFYTWRFRGLLFQKRIGRKLKVYVYFYTIAAILNFSYYLVYQNQIVSYNDGTKIEKVYFPLFPDASLRQVENNAGSKIKAIEKYGILKIKSLIKNNDTSIVITNWILGTIAGMSHITLFAMLMLHYLGFHQVPDNDTSKNNTNKNNQEVLLKLIKDSKIKSALKILVNSNNPSTKKQAIALNAQYIQIEKQFKILNTISFEEYNLLTSRLIWNITNLII